MPRIIYTIVILFIVLLGVIFAVLNAESVVLNFYFGSRAIPLSLVIILSVLLGAILGVLASMHLIYRTRREMTKLRKAADLAEKEVANLRAIPIKNQN